MKAETQSKRRQGAGDMILSAVGASISEDRLPLPRLEAMADRSTRERVIAYALASMTSARCSRLLPAGVELYVHHERVHRLTREGVEDARAHAHTLPYTNA